VACLDADTLPFPLEVRPWEPGDRMIPLGMKGYKKVSDLLTDLKIPLCDKPGVHVLCSGKEIVWVIGLRIDNRFRVTPSTKMIIRYRCKESSPVHPDFL
jgi:tRNA(Ile)-lysidine synthase